MMHIRPVLPEILVFAMACVILLADLFWKRRFKGMMYGVTQATLIAAGITAYSLRDEGARVVLHGMVIGDRLSIVLQIAIFALTAIVLAYSRTYIAERGVFRSEFFVLALTGVVGMCVMVSAAHFLSLYLGLELLSLSLYALIAMQRDSIPATEAAMKYFVLGALSSGLLLYGLSMLYGATGSLAIGRVATALAALPRHDMVATLGLVFVLSGLAFKLGAVPFHMWIPDVYEGAPTAVTLYVGAAPKIAAFALFLRLLVAGLHGLSGAWQEMLVLLAFLSMAVGNVVAIAQTNLKRMLAYSAIAHMGFLLLGLLSARVSGYADALFYALIYAFMTLGAFGVIILLSRKGFEAERLEDLRGLYQRSPWYAWVMLLFMFSMAGIPPTIGFYAKLAVIQAAVSAGFYGLAVAAVLFSVIGAFYYLRVVKLMFFDAPVDAGPLRQGRDLRWILSVNGIAMVLAAPWAGTLIAICRAAVRGLP
ncbi:NADH-quinone oxidoreductase subunit NuoN [Acidiferrobacter sp. SPIII_3]|uniref:NADH-quinone oxidoreductase subunit NuoN n=1 Tax=Acidiferrobacter sp. SPIII_3 TaxID=1281578 RepID=UPI000D731066|nr:NADH-quinone oxidoreductase subunit NuoN [Acidiferrobacter sp. SPIII_3]AWP22714.1 NADH-quinone oxidoreductase subunit NuoN [Acidiferrobacter sp. SPIII_3]